MELAARASQNLGLDAHATFSGALQWHTFYPWPPRPAGLVEEGFKELAQRWLPILDAFDAAGVDVCYEIHPGEDLHDGVTFERFLAARLPGRFRSLGDGETDRAFDDFAGQGADSAFNRKVLGLS